MRAIITLGGIAKAKDIQKYGLIKATEIFSERRGKDGW